MVKNGTPVTGKMLIVVGHIHGYESVSVTKGALSPAYVPATNVIVQNGNVSGTGTASTANGLIFSGPNVGDGLISSNYGFVTLADASGSKMQ